MGKIILAIFFCFSSWAFEDQSCVNDANCISTKAGSCGCSSGGEARSIHKNRLRPWLKFIKNEKICAAVLSEHWSCIRSNNRCIKNACTLVKRAPLPDFSTYNSAGCEKIKLIGDQSRCFYSIAVRDKNFKLCENIKGGRIAPSANQCLDIIFSSLGESASKLSLDFCKRLSNKNKFNCASKLAKNNKNLLACMILNKQESEVCRRHIFKQLYKQEGVSYCTKLKESVNQNQVDLCYIHFSKKLKSSKLCLKISDYPSFYKCVRDVARDLKRQGECNTLLKWKNIIPKNLEGLPNYSMDFCKSLKPFIRF